MRYLFGGGGGGGKLLYNLFPPICQGGENGKIYYIAMFPPIQVRRGNGYFPGEDGYGGKWLYDTGCLTLQPYFYPTSLTYGDGQIRGKTGMLLFLLQHPQWSPIMKSRTMYISKGKIFNFFILNGAFRNFYGNLNWSLKNENKSKDHAKIGIF